MLFRYGATFARVFSIDLDGYGLIWMAMVRRGCPRGTYFDEHTSFQRFACQLYCDAAPNYKRVTV